MKDRLQNVILWLTVIFELIALFFVIVFWESLQIGFRIDPDNTVALALFGNSLVLGFLRALVICLIPIIVLLTFAITLKFLHSKTIKIGPVELEETAERLHEVERIQDEQERAHRDEIREREGLEREKYRILVEELMKMKHGQERRK